jgi:diguanylate cyclase (GGDEF)-like protein/PAS domain S-box-containing protein
VGIAKILLVENDDLAARFLSRELTRMDYEVCGMLTTGELALERTAQLRPDLILMDIGLDGELDGIDTAIRIAAEHATPTIFLSGYTDEETLVRARKANPYGYLVKPISEQSLNATLQMAMERLTAERTLQRHQARLREAALVFDATRDGILILDHDHRISSVNHRFTEITGFDSRDVVGGEPHFLDDCALPPTLFAQIGGDGGRWCSQIDVRKRDGTSFPATVTIAAVRDDALSDSHYVVLIADISATRLAEERLYRMAHHDPLTGLPNRQLMMDRLRIAIEQAKRHRSRMAILFIDLDKFKAINDSLGHAAGDELLRVVAARMQGCVRSVDTVARLGGDEFVVVLDAIGEREDVAGIAHKILEAVAQPIPLTGADTTITTSASIGIALFPEAAGSVDQLIRAADAAMYEAKSLGRDKFVFFSRRTSLSAAQRSALERELRRAIDQRQMVLHYQPQFALESGRLVGVEALLRWRHPMRGLLNAGQVVPLAEAGGQMSALGEWMLRTACRQLVQWRTLGMKPPRMALNFSDCQLFDPLLLPLLEGCLREFELPAELLEMEIAETVLHGRNANAETFEGIRTLGVGLAVHNYGTGHSSLHALTRFPVRRVKIDRSLTRRICDGGAESAIANAIIAVARELNLVSLAEGVETAGQERYLRQHGCSEAQGHYYGPALPPRAIDALLQHATAVPLRHDAAAPLG